jgi:hypothetical protein
MNEPTKILFEEFESFRLSNSQQLKNKYQFDADYLSNNSSTKDKLN